MTERRSSMGTKETRGVGSSSRVLALALALATGLSLWMPVASAAVGGSDEVPPTGKELLSAAFAVKKRSFRKEGEEKRRILVEAVDAYRRVAAAVPDDHPSCAIAAYRVGEIWRSLGDRAEAESAFVEAAGYEDVRDVMARSLLELGHLDRREKHFEAAIRRYEEVVTRCPQERDRVARAIVWIGKCHRAQKRHEPAREALRRVIDGYADQVARLLEAYDLLAQVYLEEGKLRLAEETLAECTARAAALETAGDETHRGLSDRVAQLKAWKKVRAARAEAETEAGSGTKTSKMSKPGSGAVR